MSLQTLPYEVVEMLLLYINVEELPIVSNIIGFEGSDCFWRKLCKREGYNNTGENSWKIVFYNNFNWTTKKYDKRQYKIDTGTWIVKKKHVEEYLCYNPLCEQHFMHGENLVIQSDDKEIYVWNIDNSPVLLQKLPANTWKASRNTLLSCYEQEVKVYSYTNDNYCKILNHTHSSCLTYLCCCDHAITDEYFAALDCHSKVIKVVNIETREDFILHVSHENVAQTMSISLLGCYLYVIIYEVSHFRLKTFNLQKREWLDDLILVQENILNYRLEVSSDILVSWRINPLLHAGVLLNVWKSNGELLKSLSSEFILSFHQMNEMVPEGARIIRWLYVKGEYIIFSYHKTNITIWNSKDPDICKQLDRDDNYYVGQNVISSHLFVLSYSYGFKVIDFKKAIYLYDVQFYKNQSSNVRPVYGFYRDYFVNECFYVSCIEEYYEKNSVWVFTIFDFRNQEIHN